MFHGAPAVRVAFDNREARAFCGGQRFGKSFLNMKVSMGNADDYADAVPSEERVYLED